MVIAERPPAHSPIPRWLRFVLASDRAGSAWYVGLGFFICSRAGVAVAMANVITAMLWAVITFAGLWLGLLGIAMAVGLARVALGHRDPRRLLAEPGTY